MLLKIWLWILCGKQKAKQRLSAEQQPNCVQLSQLTSNLGMEKNQRTITQLRFQMVDSGKNNEVVKMKEKEKKRIFAKNLLLSCFHMQPSC